MTPRRLLELLTDSYWLHEWLIPMMFITAAIMALTFSVVVVILFLRMKRGQRIAEEQERAQAARLAALLKEREKLNYP